MTTTLVPRSTQARKFPDLRVGDFVDGFEGLPYHLLADIVKKGTILDSCLQLGRTRSSLDRMQRAPLQGTHVSATLRIIA